MTGTNTPLGLGMFVFVITSTALRRVQTHCWDPSSSVKWPELKANHESPFSEGVKIGGNKLISIIQIYGVVLN